VSSRRERLSARNESDLATKPGAATTRRMAACDPSKRHRLSRLLAGLVMIPCAIVVLLTSCDPNVVIGAKWQVEQGGRGSETGRGRGFWQRATPGLGRDEGGRHRGPSPFGAQSHLG